MTTSYPDPGDPGRSVQPPPQEPTPPARFPQVEPQPYTKSKPYGEQQQPSTDQQAYGHQPHPMEQQPYTDQQPHSAQQHSTDPRAYSGPQTYSEPQTYSDPQPATPVQPPPVGEPATPVPPNHHLRRWIPLVALLAIIGIIWGLVASNNSNNKKATPNPTVTATAAAGTVPGLNTLARDGNLNLAVRNVDCNHNSVGTGTGAITGAAEYCFVNIQATNVGANPVTFDTNGQLAYDTNGRQYLPDAAATAVANYGGAIGAPLTTGKVTNGILVFDLPQNGRISRVVLFGSPSSRGVPFNVG